MSLTKVPSIDELRNIIVDLLAKEGLDDSHYAEMISYCLELFEKQNPKDTYYGYHNASHEVIVTYNTLLAARGSEFQDMISADDFRHLFAASLFQDYEPDNTQDKPHEQSAASFVVSNHKLLNLLQEAEIDPHLVASLILRTSYPWSQKKSDLETLMTLCYTLPYGCM